MMTVFLHLLIEQHHLDFKVLYHNCSITPKFHYMIHYPEYISRYIMHTWTIIILYITHVGVALPVGSGACDMKVSIVISRT